jgi:hypothetical protein
MTDLPVVGDTLTTTETFEVNGVPTDPDTVTLQFRCGSGWLWTTWVYGTDPGISQLSPGVYQAQIATWDSPLTVVWIGTGTADKRTVLTQKLQLRPHP